MYLLQKILLREDGKSWTNSIIFVLNAESRPVGRMMVQNHVDFTFRLLQCLVETTDLQQVQAARFRRRTDFLNLAYLLL
jgi:hypothetical protein